MRGLNVKQLRNRSIVVSLPKISSGSGSVSVERLSGEDETPDIEFMIQNAKVAYLRQNIISKLDTNQGEGIRGQLSLL